MANTTTIELSDSVMDSTVMPMDDKPMNRPEIPAKLKLNATDNTSSSTMSNLPS